MREVTLSLPWPPSGNHRHIHRNGRPIALTKKYKEYLSAVRAILIREWIKPTRGNFLVNIEVHPPDKRVRDLDNVLKCILDSLQGDSWGVYFNDNQVDDIRIKRSEHAKGGMVKVRAASFDLVDDKAMIKAFGSNWKK